MVWLPGEQGLPQQILLGAAVVPGLGRLLGAGEPGTLRRERTTRGAGDATSHPSAAATRTSLGSSKARGAIPARLQSRAPAAIASP